jgi:hypothetical protein
VALEQLTGLGVSREWVRRRVENGHLYRVHRSVYAVGHPGLSREGRIMAAVLAAGPRAGGSHLTAAELWRISRWPTDAIHVISMARRRLAGVTVHAARAVDPRDLTKRHGIPLTTIERTLVDLADVLTPHQLAWVIHEAAYQDRFSVEATRAVMARSPGRKLSVLNAAIDLHLSGSAGTRSAKEDAYLASLPPDEQRLVRVNTKLEVDFHWPDTARVVEVDGAGHLRPPTRHEDAARDARLRLAGLAVERLEGR